MLALCDGQLDVVTEVFARVNNGRAVAGLDPAMVDVELTLAFRLLVPLLQGMWVFPREVICSLLLTRCRRDLFDTYTSLFQHIVSASSGPHAQIAQFQAVCSALQTLSCSSLTQGTFLWRLVLLAQHILVALPSHLLLPSIDVYLPLTLLAVMENREMTTLAEEVADPRDELLLHPIKPRAVELMEVGAPTFLNHRTSPQTSPWRRRRRIATTRTCPCETVTGFSPVASSSSRKH